MVKNQAMQSPPQFHRMLRGLDRIGAIGIADQELGEVAEECFCPVGESAFQDFLRCVELLLSVQMPSHF